jgi:hypothetical protein
MAYPVTSVMSATLITLTLQIPDNDWIVQALQDRIMALADEDSWEENPYETQDAIEDRLLTLIDSMTFT